MSHNLPSSPPPPPQAQFAFSRILIWGARRREASTSDAGCQPIASAEASNTPKRVKPHHIECSSGAELKTHSHLVDCNPEYKKSSIIIHQDVFVCLDAVDTARLLLLSRKSVFEKVERMGGNAVIEERWSCTICKHHGRRGDIYKVSIHYQGTPARASRPDPHRPVAMSEAKGVPGLMTIMSRQ